MSRRLDIDGLRAIAVLLVVMSHLQVDFLSGGFVGVDIFFVISGYVITLNLVSEYLNRSSDVSDVGIISIRGFYARRIKRIAPISFFVLVCNLIAGYLVFNSIKFQELLTEAINNVFFVGNFYQIRIGTDYLNATMLETPLRHYWSLSIEEQFYLFYPILFFITLSLHGLKFRSKKLSWNKRLLALLFFLTVASFVYSIYEVWTNPVPAYFSTLGRVWEIGVGCFICLLDTALKQRGFVKLDRAGPYIGLGLIIFSALLYDNNTRFPGVAALLPVIGAGLLVRLPGYSLRAGLVRRFLSSKVLVFFGRLSFSIYLWHWSVIVILRFIFPDILEHNLYRILIFALIIFLSFMSYKWIEIPSSRWNLNLPALYRFKSTPNLWEFIQERVAPDIKMAAKFFVAIILLAGSTQLFQKTSESTFEFIDPKTFVAELNSPEENSSDFTETLTVQSAQRINWSDEVIKGSKVDAYTKAISPAFENLRSAPWGLTLIDPQCRVFDETGPSQDSADCIKPNPSSKTKVLLLGDSHAYMLAGAIYNFYNGSVSLQIIGRSGCPIGGVLPNKSINARQSEFCLSLWANYIPQKLNATKYDVVILTDDGGTDLSRVQTAVNNVRNLNFSDAKVLFIAPSPRYPSPLECIRADKSIQNCTGKPNVLGEKVINEMHKSVKSNLTMLSQIICQGQVCPAVIANRFVTRDGSHFTGPFAELLQYSLNLPRV
jgi:peptidoglycan/LPS O-acetylase OafA/YrhL